MAEKAIGAASILLVGAVMAWLCGRAAQEALGMDPLPVRIGVMAAAAIVTAAVWRRCQRTDRRKLRGDPMAHGKPAAADPEQQSRSTRSGGK